MKVCIYGAGAIGGHLAAVLASTGNDVTVVVREAARVAMGSRPMRLLKGERTIEGPVRAVSSTAEAGPQDLVVSTVKSTGIPALAGTFGPLLKPDTPVVFAMNGIPWWYPYRCAPTASPLPDLSPLDPEGRLAATLGVERVIGCTVFSANEVVEPGVVRNLSLDKNEWTLGEPDGTLSERVMQISTLFAQEGIAAPVVPDIRRAVWAKLVGPHLAVALVSTVVGRPQSVMQNPALREIGRALSAEGQAVARAFGITIDIDPATLHPERTLRSAHKPSMLQDFEKGRALEIDGSLVAIQRFARAAGVATPHLDTMIAVLMQKVADRDAHVAAG